MRPLAAAHLKSISDLESQGDQGAGQRCQILTPRRCRVSIWVARLAARALGDQVPSKRDGGGLVADLLRLALGDRRQQVPLIGGRAEPALELPGGRRGTLGTWRLVPAGAPPPMSRSLQRLVASTWGARFGISGWRSSALMSPPAGRSSSPRLG